MPWGEPVREVTGCAEKPNDSARLGARSRFLPRSPTERTSPRGGLSAAALRRVSASLCRERREERRTGPGSDRAQGEPSAACEQPVPDRLGMAPLRSAPARQDKVAVFLVKPSETFEFIANGIVASRALEQEPLLVLIAHIITIRLSLHLEGIAKNTRSSDVNNELLVD